MSGSFFVAHNHPSGCDEPSHADKLLTAQIVEALKLFGIRLLDHFIIGRDVTSLAERGLM